MNDTIYALSSGRPPAAIAIIRISGPQAQAIFRRLVGTLPPPRTAALRHVRNAGGELLDRALALSFPGPCSATGEDLVELHVHGGRAVVNAVELVLEATGEARRAIAGEFTRRALTNGRIDLSQAQGLADLLAAETEGARRAALAAAEGSIGRVIATWMTRISAIGAQIEAALDFSDEGDVDDQAMERAGAEAQALAIELRNVLSRPSVERLHNGARIVLAGPPNAGKSSLFNALIERDAAIVTPIAGTTRDTLEAAVVRAGVPYLLVDTAGLRSETDDPVEQIGIARAHDAVAAADLVLWLGEPCESPPHALKVHPRHDVTGRAAVPEGSIPVSIHVPAQLDALWDTISHRTNFAPAEDLLALRMEQRRVLEEVVVHLDEIASASDPLIAGEHARLGRDALGGLLGVNATEAMLDALFQQFCVGK